MNGLLITSTSKGTWSNSEGKVITFDGIVYGFEQSLWFEETKLNQYTRDTDQKLLWKSWGREK